MTFASFFASKRFNIFFFYFLECILPPLLDYGNYLVTDNDSVVIYSCAVGYTLNGNFVRQCQQDGGGWDGSQPSCSKNSFLD